MQLAYKRDLYKYVHDQTIRMMNQGMGPTEIAETLTMPPGLENDWSAGGYYGTISQNSKAMYQRYVGWYDGNPATLNRLPRVEEARKYLEYMGGSAAVIARAREDFKAGHYRWVAEVMDQVVFADLPPTKRRAVSRRMHLSNWDTLPNRRHGETRTWSEHRNYAAASAVGYGPFPPSAQKCCT
jgi:alkyl sulfatase BDS1-like metallo-beta-lactamase superfamily hydrolase